MLIRIECKNIRTNEVYFENVITIRLAEMFCRGVLYGQQGFDVIEIVEVDRHKRYEFTGEPHYILKEVQL